MRIGVSPFDTACWIVQMCMRSFNVSGPFEWRESDERDEGSSESPSLLIESQSETNYDVMMMFNMTSSMR